MEGKEMIQLLGESEGEDYDRRRRMLLDYIINLEYKSNVINRLREIVGVSENSDALHLLSAMGSVQTELATLKGLYDSKTLRLKTVNVVVKRTNDDVKHQLGSEYSRIESAMERLMSAVEEITQETTLDRNNRYAIIFNGKFSYELIVGDEYGDHDINFSSSAAADYFEMVYGAMSYKVMRLGDGSSSYREYAADYLKEDDGEDSE